MLVSVQIQPTKPTPAEPLILCKLCVHWVISWAVSPRGGPGLQAVLSVGFIEAQGMMLNHKLLCNKKQEFDRFFAVLLFVQRIVRAVAMDSDRLYSAQGCLQWSTVKIFQHY